MLIARDKSRRIQCRKQKQFCTAQFSNQKKGTPGTRLISIHVAFRGRFPTNDPRSNRGKNRKEPKLRLHGQHCTARRSHWDPRHDRSDIRCTLLCVNDCLAERLVQSRAVCIAIPRFLAAEQREKDISPCSRKKLAREWKYRRC